MGVFLRGLGGFCWITWGRGVYSKDRCICQCLLEGWGSVDSWVGSVFFASIIWMDLNLLADCELGASGALPC